MQIIWRRDVGKNKWENKNHVQRSEDETIEIDMTSPQGPALEKSLEGLFS
jgi:hypothetical protein